MALTDFFEKLTIAERKIVSDGEGGYIETVVDGVTFEGAITMDSSTQARIAQKDGFTSIFTLTTSKKVPLKFSDLVKKGNEYYKVTNEASKSPMTANLDIQQLALERFTINN